MPVKFFEKLSNDYLDLLNDQEDFNVNINVGEIPTAKTFQAHSNVLRSRSLYFRNKLANAKKNQNNIKTIHLKCISIRQFEIIIKYIYGGVISLEKLEASFTFELMIVACELLLEELAKYIETYLMNENEHWISLNFARVYQATFQNNELQKLQNWCNDILVKYPGIIFDSEEFNSLHENALLSLIRRDDLQMEEVKIWNYVIKWGIAQNPGLPSDPKHWTNENFSTMKATLRSFLPFIRYFQISGDDILDSLEPYKEILDRNLWSDIMKRFLSPNRQVSSTILPPRVTIPFRTSKFSKIISEEHADEIASWIDKKFIHSSIYNPYEFKLLIRGSRDGFTSTVFWNLCNKKENLIVVMKVNGTDEILGGYNPIGWSKGSGHQHCDNSFIFSLKNGNNRHSILSRIRMDREKSGREHSNCAIYSNDDYGSCFGCICTYDLFMFNNFNQNRGCFNTNGYSFYEKYLRNDPNGYFSVDEYEVFQIQRKKNF